VKNQTQTTKHFYCNLTLLHTLHMSLIMQYFIVLKLLMLWVIDFLHCFTYFFPLVQKKLLKHPKKYSPIKPTAMGFSKETAFLTLLTWPKQCAAVQVKTNVITVCRTAENKHKTLCDMHTNTACTVQHAHITITRPTTYTHTTTLLVHVPSCIQPEDNMHYTYSKSLNGTNETDVILFKDNNCHQCCT